MTGLAQLVAARRRPAVLPDERVVDRLPGRGVPGDDGLALVGDADPIEARAVDAGVGDRLRSDPARHLPDLGRVVLDPAGPGEVLLELRVGAARDLSLAVEDKARRAGRPLVDGEDHRPEANLRRPPRAGDVSELPSAVGEAADAPARGAVLEVELDTRRTGEPGPHGVDRHRRLHAVAGSERAPRRAGPRRASPAGRRSAPRRDSPQRRSIAQRANPRATPKPPPTRLENAADGQVALAGLHGLDEASQLSSRVAKVPVAEQEGGRLAQLGERGDRSPRPPSCCRPCRAGGDGSRPRRPGRGRDRRCRRWTRRRRR